MYVFKTSGATYESARRNQKHAFLIMPRDWDTGEWVLVSKNRKDCRYGEKQIQFIMKIGTIRHLNLGEAQGLFPGNEGRWKYLVECYDRKDLPRPFDLPEVIGLGRYRQEYTGVITFKRLPREDENRVLDYLKKSGAI